MLKNFLTMQLARKCCDGPKNMIKGILRCIQGIKCVLDENLTNLDVRCDFSSSIHRVAFLINRLRVKFQTVADQEGGEVAKRLI